MKGIILIISIYFFINEVQASPKSNIINNLKNIDNLSFNFEQNINDELENGNCIVHYPKKIFCKYNSSNQKILVSNGQSLVIKTTSSYYSYPLDKTPLNLILDKKFLINNISKMRKKHEDSRFISFEFKHDDNKVNIFFNKKNYNFMGWQTVDIYQNLSITYLTSIRTNLEIDNDIFNLPKQNN